MRLSELVREDLVKVDLEAVDKWESIEELIDLLISAHELRLTDREAALEAVRNREHSLSTGLEHGLAIPHAAVDCVDDIVAALGISDKGVPFESLDGRPTRLIVLVLVPRGKFQRYVSTLSGIASLGTNRRLRERIMAADTPAQVMDAIHELEEQSESEPDSDLDI